MQDAPRTPFDPTADIEELLKEARRLRDQARPLPSNATRSELLARAERLERIARAIEVILGPT